MESFVPTQDSFHIHDPILQLVWRLGITFVFQGLIVEEFHCFNFLVLLCYQPEMLAKVTLFFLSSKSGNWTRTQLWSVFATSLWRWSLLKVYFVTGNPFQFVKIPGHPFGISRGSREKGDKCHCEALGKKSEWIQFHLDMSAKAPKVEEKEEKFWKLLAKLAFRPTMRPLICVAQSHLGVFSPEKSWRERRDATIPGSFYSLPFGSDKIGAPNCQSEPCLKFVEIPKFPLGKVNLPGCMRASIFWRWPIGNTF